MDQRGGLCSSERGMLACERFDSGWRRTIFIFPSSRKNFNDSEKISKCP